MYKGDTFRIQKRYSMILAQLLVGMIYNSAMPLLNVILFLGFVFIYYFDKVMLLKVYKRPPIYDSEFQNFIA